MIEFLLFIVVMYAIAYMLYTHKYYVQWGEAGKKEHITTSWFSSPNARVTTPNTPYIVIRKGNKTILLVDEDARNFVVRIGSEYIEVY